ncbi:hypothetical protein BDF20DRAFT_10457 [Mycotypha africana]|uniref:uncharacterized protein n=1 Tax=Mycotypha africana TaxID=64632 RepID=UPI002300B733|nr:uncharacterized protein BDF20DRAFT_10457 [Mycotypha africana]KAI8990930.1 hypothetical protein BDF20DRAFT_10457 [Mycotypha africana]
MTTIMEENKMSLDSFQDQRSFEQQSSHKIIEPSSKFSSTSREKRTSFKINFWSKSPNSVLLVSIAVFEAIIVIALEAAIFSKFYHTEFSRNNLGLGIPVYLMIFIFSQVFQVLIAWDAVRAQNTIQVIAFFLFNLCCFCYALFQFKQIADALDSNDPDLAQLATSLTFLINRLLIVIAVITGICQLLYIYVGARLYQEFGWKIYKKIGADPEIRNMYRCYQIILTILKIDFFFFLGYSIQYLVLVLRSGDYEFALTIVAIPLTCLFLLLAVYAIKHESKYLMYLFFLGMCAGIAYFIFKIYRIYDPSQRDKYKYVNETLTFFASVSLALVVLTIINAFLCYLNFGKGLKPHLNSDNQRSSLPRHLAERTLSLD